MGITNDRRKLAKEAEGYVDETCVKGISDGRASTQAKAVVGSEDNDGGAAVVDRIFPIKE